MGFTTHLYKCRRCEKEIIYTSRQKHPSFTHECKIKERKQMDSSDFYRLNEILHHRNCKINCGEQYDYWKKRINERILYLTPLINELKQKGIELATLSKELHHEWLSLIEYKEYYDF